MAKLVELQCTKTYATKANAIAAVEKKAGYFPEDLRYIVMRDDNGRYFPVFIGEAAVQAGAHFHFHVVG